MTCANRHLFYRRAALAPVCLCLVASLHLVRVWTVHQTPWKGGGFGMFSTVDDESARFLRCYLVSDCGVIPLPLPPATEKFVAELRAAPAQSKLDELARRLANQSWRWRDTQQEHQAEAIAAAGGRNVTAAIFHPDSKAAPSAPSLPEQTAARDHRLEPISLAESAHDAIPFTAVRVQCLKYRYDAAHHALIADVMLSAQAKPSPSNQEQSQ